MIYYLMHEDEKLAVFEYEKSSISRVIINDSCRGRLPLLELSSASLESKVAKWILNRGIPATRHGLSGELVKLGLNSPSDYMLSNLGLSLTDHYWVCPSDKSYHWSEVNAYENAFDFRYDLSIDGVGLFNPSATLGGSLKKKWVIDNCGIRRLIKGNYSNTCRQSLCEVLATEIHRMQGKFPYTVYTLEKIWDNGSGVIGCRCPAFTSAYTEFIPAIDIVNSCKKPNNCNYYEVYIQYCVSHGVDEQYVRNFMEYQILTDFIMSNTDRHLNNFGVLRDSRDFHLIGLAPIFDSGNSMFYNTSHIKQGYDLLDIGVTSFRKREVELLKYIRNPLLVDVSKLPSISYVYQLFKADPFCTDDMALKLIKAYSKKVDLLCELQNGVKIYSYNYLKQQGVRLSSRD